MKNYLLLLFLLISCESESISKTKDLEEEKDVDLCVEAELYLSSCAEIDLMTVGDCNVDVAKDILNMSCKEISDASEDLKGDGVSLLDTLHCKLGVLHFCEVPVCNEELDIEYCIDALENNSCGQCSYYNCLESQANCGEDGYLLNFVGKYCNRFSQVTYPRLSEFGKVWMNTVRECLIYNLDSNYYEGESCESIEARGIEDHIACYTNSGICSLPVSDWIKIASTIKPSELPLVQAISIGNKCIEDFLKQ